VSTHVNNQEKGQAGHRRGHELSPRSGKQVLLAQVRAN
jgi:hypothetical protein